MRYTSKQDVNLVIVTFFYIVICGILPFALTKHVGEVYDTSKLFVFTVIANPVIALSFHLQGWWRYA